MSFQSGTILSGALLLCVLAMVWLWHSTRRK